MASMSYLSVIERYHEYQHAVRELLASIVTGIAEPRLFDDVEAQRQLMRQLVVHYPFAELLYTLDPLGVQVADNVAGHDRHPNGSDGRGRDRSQRPYFQIARESDSVVVTEPYLSSAGGILCVTAAVKLHDDQGKLRGYLALDIDLAKTIAFLMGDTARRRFQPLFRTVFSVIVAGLFGVVLALLSSAFREMWSFFETAADLNALHMRPFGVIIFLTLALAIFDLGKTILEEEVLMHKDIFRHSSTRRTITRFIAAILIAVSIEALLLMFKAALGQGEGLVHAVWMMFAAVGLLVGLGVYVNLGARAEVALLAQKYAGK